MLIFAGPNGAGKSTLASLIARDKTLVPFLNADVVSAGLALTDSPLSEIQSGRVVLERLHFALEHGESISFESTMTGKSWRGIISKAQSLGYQVHLFYVLVNHPKLSAKRVRERVARGGHNIPAATIERRFYRSLRLFFDEYRHVVNNWTLFDNSDAGAKIVARGGRLGATEEVLDRSRFDAYQHLQRGESSDE